MKSNKSNKSNNATVFIFTNRTRPATIARYMPKVRAVEGVVGNNPLVTFQYPMRKEPWKVSNRVVRLISVTPKYLVGLEILMYPGGEQTYQFKKFLSSKVRSTVILEFNPASMS